MYVSEAMLRLQNLILYKYHDNHILLRIIRAVLLRPIYNTLPGLSYIHIIAVFLWLTHIVCVAKTQAKLLTLGSYRFVLRSFLAPCIRRIILDCFRCQFKTRGMGKTLYIPRLTFAYENYVQLKRIIGSGNIIFDLWKFKTIWLFLIGNILVP